MEHVPTLQRQLPLDGASLWDRVAHKANIAFLRGEAFLSGQYLFTFRNTTQLTVKLHLQDDHDDEDEKKDGVSPDTERRRRLRRDFFLTVPAGREVEIPMRSKLVTVSGGFFREDIGAYELFWESRRFAWQPEGIIVVKVGHVGVDANAFRADVWPGAPEIFRAHRLSGGRAVRPCRGLGPKPGLEMEDRGTPRMRLARKPSLLLPPPAFPCAAPQGDNDGSPASSATSRDEETDEHGPSRALIGDDGVWAGTEEMPTMTTGDIRFYTRSSRGWTLALTKESQDGDLEPREAASDFPEAVLASVPSALVARWGSVGSDENFESDADETLCYGGSLAIAPSLRPAMSQPLRSRPDRD